MCTTTPVKGSLKYQALTKSGCLSTRPLHITDFTSECKTFTDVKFLVLVVRKFHIINKKIIIDTVYSSEFVSFYGFTFLTNLMRN